MVLGGGGGAILTSSSRPRPSPGSRRDWPPRRSPARLRPGRAARPPRRPAAQLSGEPGQASRPAPPSATPRSRVLAFAAGVLVFLELVLRDGLVYVVTALAPLSFAAMTLPAARSAAREVLKVVVATAFSKPAVFVALRVGLDLVYQADPSDDRLNSAPGASTSPACPSSPWPRSCRSWSGNSSPWPRATSWPRRPSHLIRVSSDPGHQCGGCGPAYSPLVLVLVPVLAMSSVGKVTDLVGSLRGGPSCVI